MENKLFNIKDTLYDITEKYPESIELLASIGFENIKNESQRNTIGRAITIENALKTKNINLSDFTQRLIEIIEENKSMEDKRIDLKNENSIKVAGLLPCPVKTQLTEAFEEWIKSNEKDLSHEIEYEFKAASFGVDWLQDIIESDSSNVLPDIFISAGFEMFFDKKLFGKYKNQKLFKDITGIETYNPDFENDYMNLKDPVGEYSMLAVVPAVFLINREEIGDQEIPRSWEELLSGRFENSVSLPVSDFDLFNSMLLHIYKSFGDEGLKNLGRAFKSNMHPSEMLKSNRKPEKPVVTIMPYFFTKMVTENGPMIPVWPEDGAIISPIFMLSKSEKSERLKPIVDFFASKAAGEILAHEGKFPSVNPEVDNRISDGNKFMWLGWDFIKANDISKLIVHCENIFNEASQGGAQN